MSLFLDLGRLLIKVLKLPSYLIRVISAVRLMIVLQALLLILIGSFYSSIVAFITWGSIWIGTTKDYYLGWIAGVFFFSAFTLSMIWILATVVSRVQRNGNSGISDTGSTT